MSASAGKRRRSPRLSKSPPPKRKKLERTVTVEVEEHAEEREMKRKGIERKTTSFLEEIDKDDKMTGVVASLSISNQEKLMKTLSSIMSPTESTDDPYPIHICQMEGVDERCSFTKRFDDAGPCWLELPFDFLLQLISLLPAREAWKFGKTCRYTMVLLTSFSSHLNLPIGERSAKSSQTVNIPGFNIQTYEGYNSWNFLDKKQNEEVTAHYTAAMVALKKSITKISWERPSRGLLVQRSCVSQPEGLSLQLYDYQAQGLTWMLAIERAARKKQPIVFSSLLSIPGRPNLVFNTKEKESIPFIASKSSYKLAEYQNSFQTQGGIFADEMGLGKTISMIALILSNPRVPHMDGTFSPCFTPVGGTPAILESKATLLLCPSPLVDQWASEIRSHTSLVCYTVATAAQHRKLSYSTVMNADVVIVSSKFLLSNPSYQGLLDNRNKAEEQGNQSGKISPPSGRRSRRVATKRELVDPEPSQVSPLFHLVAWHRIILDEAHEMVQQHNLSRFRSNYRWYVTGTPFPDTNRYREALDFLTHSWSVKKYSNGLAYYLKQRAIKNSIFWRNTKISVGVQVEIPPVIERIQIVYLSPIEQALYDTAMTRRYGRYYYGSTFRKDQDRRLVVSDPHRFCQQLNICEFQDPRLPQKYIEYINTRIQRLREELNFLRGEDTEKDTTLVEGSIMEHICRRACFARLFCESEGKCDTCCEDSPSLVKIPCQHKLCIPCLKEITSSSETVCMKCNTAFDISAVTSVNKKNRVLDQETLFSVPEACDELSNEMRSIYGTKMAATVSFIVKIMKESDAKMIVFSQYEPSLNHLIAILEEIDPVMFKDAIVQLKGNPHVRKKRLARFNSTGDDSARVITMSLQNSASGTHLAAASHVLLLDPIIGSEGDALATDAQAIARAHRLGQREPVQAIRFIVARTIDQTDYEKAYGAIVQQKRGLGPKSARK